MKLLTFGLCMFVAGFTIGTTIKPMKYLPLLIATLVCVAMWCWALLS